VFGVARIQVSVSNARVESLFLYWHALPATEDDVDEKSPTNCNDCGHPRTCVRPAPMTTANHPSGCYTSRAVLPDDRQRPCE